MNVNFIVRMVNNTRRFFKRKALLRVHKHKNGFYQVQVWDYDSMDIKKIWGKCWNTIYIRKEYASKLGIPSSQFAVFDRLESATIVKVYFENHPDQIYLSASCSDLCSGV